MAIDPCLLYPDTVLYPDTLLYPKGFCPTDPGTNAWYPMQAHPRSDKTRFRKP